MGSQVAPPLGLTRRFVRRGGPSPGLEYRPRFHGGSEGHDGLVADGSGPPVA